LDTIQKKPLSSVQLTQESGYANPYHHYVQYGGGKRIQLFNYWPWSVSYIGRLHLVATELAQRKFDSLLDIGCGDGKLISELSEQFKTASFVGIDYSDRAIQLSKALVTAPNADFLSIDITDTDADHLGQFDVVTLVEVIEHIEPTKLDGFMASASRFVKPGGLLICTVPSINIPLSKKHYQHFSIETLRDAISRQGLVVNRATYVEKQTWWMPLLQSIFVNKVFVVRSQKLLQLFFRLYFKFCLPAPDGGGAGLFLVATKTASRA
jgi:2-polyprenyl-3-methyl-5-hydroxy-6-metoxy-1,4-benzoquinol methylase